MPRLPTDLFGGGGGWLALTATLSHFRKLELLGSGRNADLTEGQLDAI
jgi:hypothetical protein